MAGVEARSGGSSSRGKASTWRESRLNVGTPRLTAPFERSTAMARPTTLPGGNDNIDCFLDPAAFGHHVLDDQYFFAGRNFEAAPQNQSAFLLLDKDKAARKLSGDFLAEDQTAHGWGNNGDRPERTDFGGQGRAEFFDDGHLLQGEGALEELAAVEAAAQDEMSFEQRAGVAENLAGLRFGSWRDGRPRAQKSESAMFGFSMPLSTRPAMDRAEKMPSARGDLADWRLVFCFPALPGGRLKSRMPKWCKTIIAVLLLPLCIGAVKALWLVLRRERRCHHDLGGSRCPARPAGW